MLKYPNISAGGEDKKSRLDGRSLDSLRPICVSVGVIKESSGSAFLQIGKTKVFASVFGPLERKNESSQNQNSGGGGQGTVSGASASGFLNNVGQYQDFAKVNVDFRLSSFSQDDRRSRNNNNNMNNSISNQDSSISQEKFYSIKAADIIGSSIQRHLMSKCQIDIQILVIDDGGGIFTAGLTCASIALSNAKIPLYDLITSIEAVSLNDRVFLDPSDEERKFFLLEKEKLNESASPSIPIFISLAIMPVQKQIVFIETSGLAQADKIQNTLDLVYQGCETLYDFVKNALKEKA